MIQANWAIFERNLNTVYAVSNHGNIRLCLMTHPFSNVLKYGEDHDKVYRPHMTNVNQLLRKKAAQYSLPLIDADRLMTGEEDLFCDPVHVIEKGEMIKAFMIGTCLLKELGLQFNIRGEWKAIEDWISAKTDMLKQNPNEQTAKADLGA